MAYFEQSCVYQSGPQLITVKLIEDFMCTVWIAVSTVVGIMSTDWQMMTDCLQWEDRTEGNRKQQQIERVTQAYTNDENKTNKGSPNSETNYNFSLTNNRKLFWNNRMSVIIKALRAQVTFEGVTKMVRPSNWGIT